MSSWEEYMPSYSNLRETKKDLILYKQSPLAERKKPEFCIWMSFRLLM